MSEETKFTICCQGPPCPYLKTSPTVYYVCGYEGECIYKRPQPPASYYNTKGADE